MIVHNTGGTNVAGYVVGIVVASLAGIGLGLLYFGGLWLTVWRLPTAAWPALLALGSFWLRAGLCLLGFYLVSAGDWKRVLACLLGFIGVRTLLVRHWGPARPAYAVTRRGNSV